MSNASGGVVTGALLTVGFGRAEKGRAACSIPAFQVCAGGTCTDSRRGRTGESCPSENRLQQRAAMPGWERGMKSLGIRCLRAPAASVTLFWVICGNNRVLCKLVLQLVRARALEEIGRKVNVP